MATEILMPELGESVHEGTVTRWLKQVGETVKEDEPVVEIMTDKVNTELQAPASGVLVKILIPEGENVQVFQALGLIGDASEIGTAAAAAPSTEPVSPIAPEVSPTPVASERTGRKWFTPVVRSIAKEHGIADSELTLISGSGEGGRVTKRDVEAFLNNRGASGGSVVVPPAQPAPTTPRTPKPVPATAGADQEIVTLTGMRKAIADAMVKAHQTPSVSTITDVDCTRMVAFRTANKDSFQEMYGVKLTYTPFFIKAATEALMEVPLVNSSMTDDGKLLQNKNVNMGVAVALGDGSQGLIVPVISDCNKKSLVEIAKELDATVKRARDNKLSLEDIQGATFSLTNPGTYGALFGTPMIPPHQGGILGTYAIKEMPVVLNGAIAIRPIMHLVLSYDHRIIDGMVAGKFLKAIKDRLEAFDFFR